MARGHIGIFNVLTVTLPIWGPTATGSWIVYIVLLRNRVFMF